MTVLGSFESVLEEVVKGLLANEHEIVGMDFALQDADKAGIEPEYAETFLVGLESCRIWYDANRWRYGMASNLTSGNSRYSAKNRRLIEERNDVSRFGRAERENLLLLGYMRKCGTKTVSKRFLDPLAMCIREILGLPYYERNRKVTQERVYRVLHKRGSGFRRRCDPNYKERNGQDRAMTEGEDFFDEIHATRTVLVG